MSEKIKIPQSIRYAVWYDHIGAENGTGKCWCCERQDITWGNFECGHVVSRKNGGSNLISNLRPVCGSCNKSVGTRNMEEFRKEFGLSKSKPINNNLDLQLTMLREKLEFIAKQLEEKDRQLEHYKQLVKTLKDVNSFEKASKIPIIPDHPEEPEKYEGENIQDISEEKFEDKNINLTENEIDINPEKIEHKSVKFIINSESKSNFSEKKEEKKTCRCGTGATEEKLGKTCAISRCPCFKTGKGCINCRCENCNNPHNEDN